jgi:hypothetical protein
MDFSQHVAVSAPLGAAAALGTGDPAIGVAFFLSGVFIDLDHLPDFWREQGFTLSIGRLNRHFGGPDPVHLWLPLHAWEWPGLLLAACWGLALPRWAWAAGAGWLFHLILDERYNELFPWAYWFMGRLNSGFRARSLFQMPRD